MKLDRWSFIFLAGILSVTTSCEKAEIPIPAHDPGDVITSTVDMDGSYKWQIYVDLKTNTIISKNLKTDWDLGFETTANGYRIILNSSKAMFSANKETTDFLSVTDTLGFSLAKRWDEPSGNLDSTAIDNWLNTSKVYLIDRGYSETGAHQGFRKIQFQSVDQDKYTIRFSELNGNGDVTMEVNKDSLYNFTFFSFSNGGKTVQVEPPKSTWDLCFSQYTHVFYNPVTPYLVTGCLLNRYQTQAVMDSSSIFNQITFNNISAYTFSTNTNTIGYDWKTYTGGVYVTNTNVNYIVKDSEGFYYKLHFIDFYNATGVKGNPKWEYQKL